MSFVPYAHQAMAFARLAGEAARSTLVAARIVDAGQAAMSRRTDEAERVLAIDQASAPLLHADLARLRKGPKRVQRLRMQALQGLIFEARPKAKPPRAQGGITAAVGVFDAPADGWQSPSRPNPG